MICKIMRYLNKSLQEAYSRLWSRFGGGVFSFQDATMILGKKVTAALNIMSHLRRRGWLIILGRKGKKRIYKLIDPADGFFALTGIKNMDKFQNKIQSSKYLPVILKTCRLMIKKLEHKLHSIVLYGSIARGTPSAFSDIDLLVIVDDIGNSIGERLDFIYSVIKESEVDIDVLRNHNVFTNISILPLTKKEAMTFIPIYLDITQDGIILFDKDDFFSRLMTKLTAVLNSAGVKKKHAGNLWYWEMDPKKELGMMEIEA